MKNKKTTGSYYTPINLANFVATYCLSKLQTNTVSVLEPSVGDGSFISALNNSELAANFENINITIVEREKAELDKAVAIDILPNIILNAVCSDYLDFHSSNHETYSLIIGNPPYVKKNHLTEAQKTSAKNIHAEKGLSDTSINNIWTSFLVSGLTKLNDDGILAFILPLELLQVKFTEEIRTLLKEEFSRIEIFTFNELQFQECKGQDTVLIIGYKQDLNPGTFYTNINSLDDLEQNNFIFYQNLSVTDSNKKWTHHFITPDEYGFLEELKSRLNPVAHFVNNKAGIVTAANDFFIVNKDVVEDYSLQKFTKKIVQKGFFVNGSVTFKNEDYLNLVKNNKPAYLLDFNLLDDAHITDKLRSYFAKGIEQEIPDRFKCRQRNKWYQIPNVAEIPVAFFFKRAHEYPKLIKNDAQVLVTDSAYKIEMKPGYNLDNFIFSFYNSLTLTFAELEGRYYGGGVLELTPNEFRILPMPMVQCNDFENYVKTFKGKLSIEEILREFNYMILNQSLGLRNDEIDRIELIRQKLINKRHRNHVNPPILLA